MKVVLIGATGFVGTAILNELLQRGHQVTAIARNAEAVKQHNNAIAKEVNVLNAAVKNDKVYLLEQGYASYEELEERVTRLLQ